MIKVITNSLGSGDWITVLDTRIGETIFSGHSITPRDLVEILTFENELAAKLVEVTDEEMGTA